MSNSRNHWTPEEQKKFLHALQYRPNISWAEIAVLVGTRSSRQVRTHAQKHYEKMERWSKKREKVLRDIQGENISTVRQRKKFSSSETDTAATLSQEHVLVKKIIIRPPKRKRSKMCLSSILND